MQTNDVLGQCALLSGSGIDASMAHTARHADQAVDTSERDRDGKDLSGCDNSFRNGGGSSLKGKHGTCAACLRPVEVVLRVRLESRVADLESVALEVPGNGHGVGLLLFHANSQRLDTTQEQPRVERTETASRGVDGEVESVTQFRAVGGHYTSHDIVVTRQVFGAALVHNISTQVEGVLEVRGEHSVVDNDKCLGVRLVGERGECRDVDDLHERVRGGLEKDHGSLFRQDGSN